MADVRAWEAFRNEVADLLRRIDDHIEAERAAARLSSDEVRLRKLENAPRLGRNLARSSEFASEEAEADLRGYLLRQYNDDRQLADAALAAARDVWREQREQTG